MAKVDQIVTKEVHLVISAGSEEEAEAKALEAVAVYPSKVTTEGVENMLTVKQKCWPPKKAEVSKITQVKDIK